MPRARVGPALANVACSLAYRPACPLLPAGREANTINQLLADENMRKQNAYVEVGGLPKMWGIFSRKWREALTIETSS